MLETYPQLNTLVKHLTEWFYVWAISVSSNPPTFQDPVTSNPEICGFTVQETIERLRTIIGCERHTENPDWNSTHLDQDTRGSSQVLRGGQQVTGGSRRSAFFEHGYGMFLHMQSKSVIDDRNELRVSK